MKHNKEDLKNNTEISSLERAQQLAGLPSITGLLRTVDNELGELIEQVNQELQELNTLFEKYGMDFNDHDDTQKITYYMGKAEKMMGIANKGLKLALKLKNPEDRYKHGKRMVMHMASIRDVIKQLEDIIVQQTGVRPTSSVDSAPSSEEIA